MKDTTKKRILRILRKSLRIAFYLLLTFPPMLLLTAWRLISWLMLSLYACVAFLLRGKAALGALAALRETLDYMSVPEELTEWLAALRSL